MSDEAKSAAAPPTTTTSARRAARKPRAQRGVLLHVALLVVAVGGATTVWLRDKEPKVQAGDVTVWSGRAGDVVSIAYTSKTKKVEITARKDQVGRYFVGTSERDAAPPPVAKADAGAPPASADKPKTITTELVSVGAAEKIAEAFAPLKAMRALGRIGDDRAAEFGLAEPEGTLSVRVGASEHTLAIGSPTPGGGDRYVKDPVSGDVFVVRGDAIRDLDSADSRLVERELHEWKDADLSASKLSAGGKTRELVRGGVEGKRFWADRASPETNDETLGNWMSKLERLRPSEYVAKVPEGKETVVRVEYSGGRAVGFVELVKAPSSTASGKSDFFVVSERTRQFGKVPQAVAEQVEQDVGAVVK